MKTTLISVLTLAIVLLVSVPSVVGAAGPGWGTGGSNTPTVLGGTVDASESEDLQFMREEEKLARDVYLQLADTWDLAVFSNIANSEQKHMDSVATLLDRYDVADPASDTIGVFTNQTLQNLYEDLVAKGSSSLADALKVGAAIEEIDIQDLETRLAQTDNADIQQVYGNLEKGSYNHLRAFVRNLETQSGEVYVPQYLTAQNYAAIIEDGNSANGTLGNGTATNDRRGGWR